MSEEQITKLTRLVETLIGLRAANDSRTGIYEALPLIMDEVGHIEKSRNNAIQNYKFRGIDDVYAALQKLLAKHKVTPIPRVLSEKREDRITAKGATMIYTVLEMQYTLYHADGSSVVASTMGEAGDSGDKSTNKSMSAAQKYAFLQIFCIPTEEDKDTENQSPEWAPNGQSKVQPQQQEQRQAQPKQQQAKADPKKCEQCNQTTNKWCGKICKDCFDKNKEAEPKPEPPKSEEQQKPVGVEPPVEISPIDAALQDLIDFGKTIEWAPKQVAAWCANQFKLEPSKLKSLLTLENIAEAKTYISANKPPA